MLIYRLVTAILLGALIQQTAHAQDTTSVSYPKKLPVVVDGDTVLVKTGKPGIVYHSWVYGHDASPGKMRRGFIQSVADSGIVFSLAIKGNNFVPKNRMPAYYAISSIEKIKIRRKGSVRRGIVIGAGAGFLIGGALGFAGIPDYGVMESLPPAENAGAGGIIFSIPGMIIGGVVGSLRMKIPLNKNPQQYERYKKIIASYSITNTQ